MSMLEGVQSHSRLFGPYGVWLAARARLLGKPLEVAVKVDGIVDPIHLRLRTTDVSVFEEIILDAEYYFETPKSPRLIVDAGANIGMTSVFFANLFPEAKIISVEPEASNFEMLRKNAAPYSNIQPLLGALWKENVELCLSDPGTGSWGFQTHERTESEGAPVMVRGMTVDSLMAQCGTDHIDVLKMDIEGSEKEVFETCAAWIGKVGMIIVELHDRSRNGCSRSAYAATKDFEFDWCKGETTFFARREYSADQKHRWTPPDVARSAARGSPRRSRILSVVT